MSFKEGTAWALRPFLQFFLPLIDAWQNKRQFEVLEHLRKNSPLLTKDGLKERKENVADRLSALRKSIEELAKLITPASNATVAEVLQFAEANSLIRLDDRISFPFAGTGIDNKRRKGR